MHIESTWNDLHNYVHNFLFIYNTMVILFMFKITNKKIPQTYQSYMVG